MGYEGQIAIIPLGKGGLWTDSPQQDIPGTNLVRAINVQYANDVLEKEAGSRRWNTTAFTSGIKMFKDFWVDEVTQRVMVLLKDGRVYKLNNYYTNVLISPTGLAPLVLNPSNMVSIVPCGKELSGRDRKAFIMTGNNPVQVVSADNNTRTNIANPPVDWSGVNQPFAGIIHRNSLFAFGNANDTSRIYKSLATDHENFTGTPISYSVYPGEGEKLVMAHVFRGRLYVFKYPMGVYQLVDDDIDPANWYFTKFADDFGGVSPQGSATVLDDVIIANSYGSLTSLKAALVFGDVATSDVFHQYKVFRFAENEVRKDVFSDRNLMYYPSKKTLFASFQSTSNYKSDRICRLDYKMYPNDAPKISWSTKDQPNCLGKIKDDYRVERPFYGADDGFLYQMDLQDRWVGDSSENRTAYLGEAITPVMDFSQGNAVTAQQNKLFDFLEIDYEASGDWNLNVDIYIDGRFSITRRFNMGGRSNLNEFNLNLDPIDGGTPYSQRQPLNGTGKRIQFRMYNEGLGENFKLTAARIFYRLSGNQGLKK